jgi:uncharacterized protein YndB with AHSA1/START domain
MKQSERERADGGDAISPKSGSNPSAGPDARAGHAGVSPDGDAVAPGSPGPAWTDTRTVRTTASAERAWRAFADARIVQGWFADEAAVERNSRVDAPATGARSGIRSPLAGTVDPMIADDDGDDSAMAGDVIVHRFPAFGFEVRNEVVESDRGRRLVLRMAFPGRPPMTQEIIIRSVAGETVIEMTNSGFGDEEWEGQWHGIDSGWKLSLAQLRHYLENYFGRVRTSWFVMQPARFDWQQLRRHFHEPALLANWLTETHDGHTRTGSRDGTAPEYSGDARPAMDAPRGEEFAGGRTGAPDAGIGLVGDDVRLVLRAGMPLSGHVLEDSGREILLAWRELEGTLELKAFEAGPGNGMLALRASTWSDPVLADEPEAWMRDALGRLASLLG